MLFNSGVGYFQRSGTVDGDARVDLQFQTGEINDLIKSLVIDDANGKVLPVRYDSQESIEKTLRSFNLSSNPSYGEILNQARGEKVELTLVANNTGLPGSLQGTIIGMESGHRLLTPTATATADVECVNLMCAEGLRSVALNQIQRLRFLNPALVNELRRALEVVASGHDSQKKSVRLGFRGDAKREVKVGYVTENPIWKTSYRVVMDKQGKATLLGWANIENTSDEDWRDIKLTLVSARPISFQMDMYQPLFIPRPTVEPQLFASLRPPTYAGPLTNTVFNGNAGGFQIAGAPVTFNGNAGGFGGFQFGGGIGGIQGVGGIGGGVGGFQMGGGFGGFGAGAAGGLYNGGGMFGQTGNLGNQFGFQGIGNPLSVNRYQTVGDGSLSLNKRLTYKDLQQRRIEGKEAQADAARAKQVGEVLANVDPELVESALTAEQLGNPARFVIDEKVSLPRQQSAMIPILDQAIDSARVSIYNGHDHAKHPLFELKIKNNSKQSLMQGPIAVYEERQYAGDSRILDLQPGEERYISYGVDTGVEIAPFEKVVPGPEMVVRTESSRLHVSYKLRTTRTYVIKNRSPQARKIVIEQPFREGWKFVESRKFVQSVAARKAAGAETTWNSGDAEKPSELTRDLYRFNVDVKAGETVKYEVSEELPRSDPFERTKQIDQAGFFTALGLEIWIDSKRAPDGTFGVELFNDKKLTVTHKDRRTTTYSLTNSSDVERTVWLEHFVPDDRRLLGNIQPEPKDARRYRFKFALAPGKTATQAVTEEYLEARPEAFGLKAGPAMSLPGGAIDVPIERFITNLGFEVWVNIDKPSPAALTSGRFIKDDLHTAARERNSATYFIHNLGVGRQSFTLDHLVRSGWSFVGAQKPVEGLRNCYRFALKPDGKEIISQSVTEERTTVRVEKLADLNDERAKELLKSANISDAVKGSIVKGRSIIKGLAQTEVALKELQVQLKAIADEQARLKDNFEKLPPGAELYKRLVDKFDKQETALENVQKQIAEKTALGKSQRQEYDEFLQKLKDD